MLERITFCSICKHYVQLYSMTNEGLAYEYDGRCLHPRSGEDPNTLLKHCPFFEESDMTPEQFIEILKTCRESIDEMIENKTSFLKKKQQTPQ